MRYRVIILLIPLLFFSCVKEVSVNGLVITKVNVVDVKTGTILQDQDIYIFEDKISDILPHDPLTVFKSKTINGSGKYAIPGLWDMHAHIVDWEWVPRLYTSLGVTGLRTMHGGSMISEVQQEREDGFYRGFEFLYSGPIVDGPGENWAGSVVASNPQEGRQIVRDQVQKGYDFIKVYNYLDKETYFAIADECNRLGIPFAGHQPLSVTTKEVIAAGQKSIEHSWGTEYGLDKPEAYIESTKNSSAGEAAITYLKSYDASRIPRILEATDSKGTWFCPTIMNLKSFAYETVHDSIFKSDPRLKYLPAEEKAYWFGQVTEEGTPTYLMSDPKYSQAEIELLETALSFIKPMRDNGARFLAGTDTSNPYIYPGFSLHDELQACVELGFTELEALQTATLNPAIYAEREGELGTLEKWKIANILLLDANPLDDISNTRKIFSLIRRGEYLDRITLDSLRIEYSKEE